MNKTVEWRQYKNPPIVEALCEFRFSPGQDQDLTIPGHYHEKIKASYPGKPRNKDVFQANLKAKEQNQDLTFSIGYATTSIQFPNEGDTRLVTIAENMLSIHILRPYSHWEDFKARITDALNIYIDTVKPTGITRIGIRYINQIDIKKKTIMLQDYFVSAPRTPESLPVNMTGFFSRAEHIFKDKSIKLMQTFTSAEAPAENSSFILDLDVISEFLKDPLPLNLAMNYVEDLRQRERERERVAFEALITEKTREIFDNE